MAREDVTKEQVVPSHGDDYFQTQLNPCSLAGSQVPVRGKSGVDCWPTVVGCYHLQDDGTRNGLMYLHLVKASDGGRLTFGKSYQKVEHPATGVLDGKWLPRHRCTTRSFPWLFATARSSGELCLHSFHENEEGDFRLDHITTSLPLEHPKESTSPLCLALNWSPRDDCKQITSSYSNGCVAVHDVIPTEAGSYDLVQREVWFAHSLFGSAAAEVWSTCFAANGRLILSGGDDAKIKFWDVRTEPSKPIRTYSDHFEAGVTVLSPHPRNENLIAAGSYDETVRLYDVRYDAQRPLYQSESLGGGIWRLSWHPYHDCRLLFASMHGGCGVVTTGNHGGPFTVEAKFPHHKSMVYGVDWLVHEPHKSEASSSDAVASCSFYDRAVFIWRPDAVEHSTSNSQP